MKALAVIVLLSCSAAFSQPADAPLVTEQPDGSVVFSPEGYARLTAVTDRLQTAEHRLTQRVAELEASPRLTVPALVAIVTTCLAVGVVTGWRLKEITR